MADAVATAAPIGFAFNTVAAGGWDVGAGLEVAVAAAAGAFATPEGSGGA
jgi:hypothetical protein